MSHSVMVTGLVAMVASALLVAVMRRYAIGRDLVDHPGERTSHSVPTPRGGGAGVILSVIVAALAFRHDPPGGALLLALAGVVLAAVVGWMDDHRSLGVGVRLGIHLIAAACVCPLAIGSRALPLAGALVAWWIFWGVAAINVTNFMDGTDGLIGSQLPVVGCYLALLAPRGSDTVLLPVAMVGSALGFLVWNWPPARIFLGDVGSGAIGLLMVVAGAAVMHDSHASLVRVFLPLFPIFLDAAWTLWRRARRGARVTHAHREHLYQRLANNGWGHARTALAFAGAAAVGGGIGLVAHRHFALDAAAYFGVGALLYAVVDHRRRDAAAVSAWPR